MRPPHLRTGQFLGRGSYKHVVASMRQGRFVAISTGRIQWKEVAVMIYLTKLHPHRHLLPLIGVEYDPLAKEGMKMVTPIARFGSLLDLQDHLEFECCEAAFTKEHLDAVLFQVKNALFHL